MRKLQRLGAVLALCVVHHAAYAEDDANKDYEYQIKAGDNLGILSRELLDSPARWADVARYNKLTHPNLVQPRQVLHIPLAWMKNHPAQARIVALTGGVKLNGQPAHLGDAVASGDRVETERAANMRMDLPDGSSLSVLEQTKLDAKKLDQKERGNYFSAIFRLVTGRIDAMKKKYPDGQAPLRIEAMHGTIGVRGTHFRMGQEGENTLAEIEQGLVGFEAGKSNLALAGGHGSVADGVHQPTAIELLPAPRFPLIPESFAPDTVSLVMPPMAGATAYRGEVAQDENFSNIIAPVSANSSVINVPDLGEGVYWVRLRAVDAHGLQGMPAQAAITVKIPPEVIPPPPPPVPANLPVVTPYQPIMSGMQMLTGWQSVKGFEYELQLAEAADFARPLFSVRGKNNYHAFDAPAAGSYFLRLRLWNAAGQFGPWCEPVAFVTK